MSTIQFYYDFISSNAYLAWTQLPDLAARYGCTVEPIAVLFAGLLEAHGQLGPAEVPPKIRWMSKNNLRKAARLGVALNPPLFHPFNPLLALRVASLPMPQEQRTALISALFAAVWVHGLHVSEADVVQRLATEIGLDGAGLIAAAQNPDSKTRLRTQTDAAIAAGVFGVPTMRLGDEIFWGYDDFPQLEEFLAGRDPIDPEQWRKWLRAPRPSASRRR